MHLYVHHWTLSTMMDLCGYIYTVCTLYIFWKYIPQRIFYGNLFNSELGVRIEEKCEPPSGHRGLYQKPLVKKEPKLFRSFLAGFICKNVTGHIELNFNSVITTDVCSLRVKMNLKQLWRYANNVPTAPSVFQEENNTLDLDSTSFIYYGFDIQHVSSLIIVK